MGNFLLDFVLPMVKETSPNPVEHLLTLNSCLQLMIFRIGANTDFFPSQSVAALHQLGGCVSPVGSI